MSPTKAIGMHTAYLHSSAAPIKLTLLNYAMVIYLQEKLHTEKTQVTLTNALCASNLSKTISMSSTVPSPQPSKWRDTNLLKNILNTNPILKSIFINGVRCRLDNKKFNEEGILSTYHQLLNKQCKIGWYQVFLARMSLQWAIIQSQHLSSLDPHSTSLTDPSWTKAMCTIITTECITLWDRRNTNCHSKDLSHKVSQSRSCSQTSYP
jgi:hypothetical protein